ncbi:MAG TPA: hypothetical protein VF743_11165, partial [Acidimicrobiales bacterium]
MTSRRGAGHDELPPLPEGLEDDRAHPLPALGRRLPLVPAHIHRRVTTALQPSFRLPFVVAAIVGLVALDAWLVATLGAGVAVAARQLIFLPYLLLPMALLLLLMSGVHELGHAVAARCGGARPGAMGVGVRLVWPVFTTDVAHLDRLDRRGRLRVDAGGIYFDVLFTLAAGGLYLATHHVLFL